MKIPIRDKEDMIKFLEGFMPDIKFVTPDNDTATLILEYKIYPDGYGVIEVTNG